jgi:5-oxoprolinase (ATP-hydrolysing)
MPSGTPAPPDAWLIAVDRGGTFTDCCATDPQGLRYRAKLLSNGRLRTGVTALEPGNTITLLSHFDQRDGFFRGWNARLFFPGNAHRPVWSAPVEHSTGTSLTFIETLPEVIPPDSFMELDTSEPAPVTGARLLTGTPPGHPFPPHRFRLATTLATNALLENQGAAVALFVTAGFRDLLTIGDQRRPDLFALHHQRDRPLHQHTVEIHERLDSTGHVLVPLDPATLSALATALVGQGITTAAVALAHSDLNPSHENAVRDCLRAAGFTTISLSSDLSAQVRLLPRASTAVVDAALAPVVCRFVQQVRQALGPECLAFHCLTSAGGLAEPASFHAKDSLLSGPAGGVAGCAAAARRAGIGRILTLDMGGTSTDVARWEGDFLYQFEQHLGQSTILAPSLRIETVAAGGGSICAVTAGALSVGPRSAGADPGPACYGRGGPLTLTDVNLLLGRLDPDKASIPLLRAPALAALTQLKQEMQTQGLPVPDHDHFLLTGLLQIAIGRMAEAVRSISVRDGCDPSAYTLLAFGGAGPQHACAIAEELGIRQILVPAQAGLLSAAGAAASQPEHFGQQQLLQPLADAAWLAPVLTRLEAETLTTFDAPQAHIRRRLADLRLQGQDTALTIPFQSPAELPASFQSSFQQLYGYPPPLHRAIEVVSLRVIASLPEESLPPETFPTQPTHSAPEQPQVIQDHFSTLILEPGWSAVRGSEGSWLLHREALASTSSASPIPDAASAELFRCRFQGMVDSMGELLRRTSVSTNVKERLDYSCALLDASGHLLVNAPHIPVHLGALGECVRRTTALIPPAPGDLLITNDPAFGGSHLPDVTVICPVFGLSGQLLAYTANRAHHAEIGGITPGSMPASAKNLAEEGVVIAPTWLVKNGVSQEDTLARILTTAPHPTRALPDNLADLRAQAAAAHHGATALLALCQTHGESTIRHHLGHLTAQARQALTRTLAHTGLVETSATGHLDDGTPIAIKLTKTGGHLTIDFTGSGGVHFGNRNATPAVVRSAVLYVLRLWTGEPIPLNEGFLADVDIILPPGFLNPPFAADPSQSPAVVGGNVETSQRIVDTLIQALGFQAGSQGTMNNVIFGNATFGHYETLCGGSGAGPGYPGTDAIHTHMTNTAITDIEILERRYPVRVEEFAIRPHSGGLGRYPGGNGAIRTYHFLAPLTLSLLTEHRLTPPLGHAGGQPGACGRQFLTLPDGTRLDLPGTISLPVAAGTRLHVHTPGGGGWGTPIPASTTEKNLPMDKGV